MGFSLGIVGLPNVGKSTLFNAITKAGAAASNYPFCTIDPNVGIVEVPDERLKVLAKMHNSKKITPTAIEFVDIAGLVKGASKGEGLGNKFLANIREVDAIAHVVRCFEDPNVTHVDGNIDPKRDIEVIELELIYSDLQTVEKILDAAEKKAKTGKPAEVKIRDVYRKLKGHLEKGDPLRTLELHADEKEITKNVPYLTNKPVLYVANIGENQIKDGENDQNVRIVKEIASKENAAVVVISSKIESEIAELPDDEAKALLKDYELTESGLLKLAHKAYQLLDLITYLTSGETETRAWTIVSGTKAPQAAGVIHSDFERGFIKADAISFDQLKTVKSLHEAREKGLIRQEGKEYIVKDGDVIVFKFNV
ncbi:redox-regulated ATPase YchF [Candidatus Margulisiibacteriota bacterium]